MGYHDFWMGEEIMPPTSLRVSLLSVTPNAEAIVYANAKQCTSADDAFNVYIQAVVDKKNDGVPFVRQQDIIRRVMASGHLGIVEPVVFTFGVAGVSRALSHQLVRQRIASFCQQSQRYVKADGFDYVMPESVRPLDSRYIRIPAPGGGIECLNANAVFKEAMDCCRLAYNRLIELGVPAEDARFVLPNACETKVVVTMNARSLLHFFEQRCCMRAQWEIRALANEMLRICRGAVPVIFETAGPLCNKNKFCDEHDSCGRYPKRAEVVPRQEER